MNNNIFKYFIYIIIACNSFIYSYGGIGINPGINFFSVTSSYDSNIIENNNTVAYLTNHGIKNGLNFGAYFYFHLNDGNIDFEYNQLKKEYQFSFKNQLTSYQSNDSKKYKTHFIQKRYCVILNKYLVEKDFKPYLFSKGFLGFGIGLISSTPVIDNIFIKNNSRSFVFDGEGNPNLAYGTLSLSQLNDQITKEPLIKYTPGFILQSGYKIRLINLEIALLYRYEIMKEILHIDYGNFGTIKLKLGLTI
tara:strand:+ start:743 stop:1489 length:747 start_codon:yes stop_codon:yes gene_type:complete